MSIIQTAIKNDYTESFWENNASYTIEFETEMPVIPASNLTSARNNSQQAAISNGTIKGIAFHSSLDGYNLNASTYYPDDYNSSNRYYVYEYRAAYYVNHEAIALPTEIGGSVSGRLERFDVMHQMLVYPIES